MKRTLFIAAAVIGLGAVVALGLWMVFQPKAATEITLYGNIDLREVGSRRNLCWNWLTRLRAT
jgi:hypothetical protein